MKNILLIISLYAFTVNLNAQYPKGFDDLDALDRISDYRKEIVDSVRPLLKKEPLFFKIHSDFIEYPGGAANFDDTEFLPHIKKDGLKPFYPNYYIIKKSNGYKLLNGVVDVDGNEVIPVNFVSVNLDENGFVTCLCEGGEQNGATVMYTYNGRRLFSVPAGYVVNVDTEHRVFIIYKVLDDNLYEYRVVYYDGTELLSSVKASSLFFEGKTYRTYDLLNKKEEKGIVENYEPEVHSDPVIDRQDFLLPIRDSFLKNEWIRLATKFCDEGKWEDALMCLYQFEHVDYQDYMRATPECLLFAAQWLKCNKELGNEKIIKREFDRLISYNIMFWNNQITSCSELENKELQDELLERCREIALPILVPDYYKKMKEAQLAQLKAEKEEAKKNKNSLKAERRQRRAQIWGSVLLGLAQSYYNVLSNHYSSGKPSVRNSQASSNMYVPTSTNVSENIETDTPSEPDKPIRQTCTRCDGTGYVLREHSINAAYTLDQKKMTTCSKCGKSYDSLSKTHIHERCSSCKGTGYWEFK